MLSTKTEQKKKDPVVELLKEGLESSNQKSEIHKYMLYANPNGSGIQNDKQPGYKGLIQSVLELNKSIVSHNQGVPGHVEYPYAGTELPTKSVGMKIRVRFTIEELVSALEILNLARARIYIENANGREWPEPAQAASIGKLKLNLSFIKSMKSIVKGYLIDKLPTLIDDCYAAYYKSKGTFSYSLTETKFYKVHEPIIVSFLTWIRNNCFSELNGLPDNTPIFTESYRKESQTLEPCNSRLQLMDEMWVNTHYVKNSASYKYPPHYVKLSKIICARLGKILKTPPTAGESVQNKAGAINFLNYITTGLDPSDKTYASVLLAISDPSSKKKDFQNAVYFLLLDKMLKIVHAGQSLPDPKPYMRSEAIKLIQTLLQYSAEAYLDYQVALVYGDTFMSAIKTLQDGYTFKEHFTKGELELSLKAFESGYVNPRVMDSIYRYISVTSLTLRDNSRKFLDLSIEEAIIRYGDLSKFSVSENALVFSKEALAILPNDYKTKFASARDAYGHTGILQNGVMSLTSTIKDRSVNLDKEQQRFAALLPYANMLDEIANCFLNKFDEFFEQRKTSKTKQIALEKALAKHSGTGVNALSPQIQQVQNYTSPAIVMGGSSAPNPFAQVQLPLFQALPPHVENEAEEVYGENTSPIKFNEQFPSVQSSISSANQSGFKPLGQLVSQSGSRSPNQSGSRSPNQSGSRSPNQSGSRSPNQSGSRSPNQLSDIFNIGQSKSPVVSNQLKQNDIFNQSQTNPSQMNPSQFFSPQSPVRSVLSDTVLSNDFFPTSPISSSQKSAVDLFQQFN